MKLTKQQRAELKMKFGGHCAYCGELLGDKWHADHLAPIYRGYEFDHQIPHRGEDKFENLMPACVSCNLSKSVFSLDVWRKELTEKVTRLIKYEKNFRLVVAFGQVEIKPDPVVFFFEKWGGNKAQHNEVTQEPKWTTIKVVCQKCGHYLGGCHCNHFGDQCPHLNTSMFGDDGLAECFNCNKIINKDREVVGDVDDQHLTR